MPSVDEIAENLRRVRASATPEQVTEGRVWYPAMSKVCEDMAHAAFDAVGEVVSTEIAAGVVAAMSQNTSWADNLNRARRFLRGEMADGRGHLKRVMAECFEIDQTGDADLGLKRNAFWANLTGDLEPTTCDRWHLRAAFALDQYDPERPETFPRGIGRSRDRKTYKWHMSVTLTDEVATRVSIATEIVAAENGEAPAQCQAVIWCAIRGDGK
jgi:hypothetical protein